MLPAHIAFCISGFSGTGKDEIAKRLVDRHGAIHTGLADPAKRHMAETYGFSREQLFGPSEMRNGGDVRYPKNVVRELDAKPYAVCPHGSVRSMFEGVKGKLEPGKGYWVFSARRAFDGMPDLPYRPLRLGNAEVFFPEGHPFFFLSPRECLQKYCDLMNTMYEDTWVRLGIEIQRKIATELIPSSTTPNAVRMVWEYDRMRGLYEFEESPSTLREHDGFILTCFSDFRHRHEIRHVRNVKADGFVPIVIRVKRPGIENPPFDHRSETEQATIPDSVFDAVIDNDGTISDLHLKVDELVDRIKKERAQ